uniref:Dynein heavy chain tail domain-containing protein n=1 Tax=Amazona collaria TaxID=241587 RepID=A0A8B9GGE7_9PSIT
MFAAALSCGQQQTGETSFHPDSENTDSETSNLCEVEFAEKKDQAMEYYKTQMRSKIQMDEQQTAQQIAGESIKLEMPTVNLTREVTVLAAIPEVVRSLESCAVTWQKLLSAALEAQLEKVPQGNGPLAEVDFWRERNDNLRALVEQTKLPEMQKALQVLHEAESEHIGDLQIVLSDLRKYHAEALDNVKCLATLERHLKNLTYGAGFNIVLDTIPSLMSSLRAVWIISRHYNKDERMVPLMERIAREIAERVYKAVDLHTLFKEDIAAAKKKIADAKSTLQQWRKCYFAVRAQIEASGREPHWEFDQKRLFGKTDYMASVCQDLIDILQVTEEFYNIFGPELKAATGNPNHVEDLLMRVNELTRPIEELSFDPFSVKSARGWKSVMEDFREEVIVTEEETKYFIDESFKTLRSAEAAFDILLNLKHIRSREAISKQMMMKFNDILDQYCKEVESINQIFVENLEDPPLYKNHPPVAGAIYWSRSLLYRIKHTIIRFQEVEELLTSERGKEVKQIYLQVAKKMKEYEDQKYSQWRDGTQHVLPPLLKNSLLTSSVKEKPVTKKSVHFIVNFSPLIQEIIIETKYMEQLGLPVPETARYVALQEDKYLRYTDRLQKVLDQYHTLMETLNEAEIELLDDHIKKLWEVFKSGHSRLNWNSLGIGDFIFRCTQAVRTFESLVHQIHNIAEDVSNRLLFIESTNLFKFPLSKSDDKLPGAREFFESIMCERAKDVAHMVRKYSAIPQLLIKVEGRVTNTNSGKSPKLTSYYAYWENRIYQALAQLIMKNLQSFNAAVLANVPLFQTEAVLSVPEITLQPNDSEIDKITIKCIRDCVEVTKHFVRWMHGTCIECPPQHVEDEVITFSFYTDISQNLLIVEQAVLIIQNVRKLLSSLNKYLNQWKRYHLLWKLDKDIAVEKLAAEKPACVTFDEQFQYYLKIAQEVTQQPMIKDEQCIRLQLAPLACTVEENARSWVMSLGKLLNESARQELFSLQEEIQVGVFSLVLSSLSHGLKMNLQVIYLYLTPYYDSA